MADARNIETESHAKEYNGRKEKQTSLPQFASPCSKRPFTNQETQKLITKRTKYNCDDVEKKAAITQLESMTQTTDNKKELRMIMRKKEDTLRKLNLVKMYRAKNNLSDLEELISKWRSLSQTAAQDLYEKFSKDKEITMGQFLDGMRISHDLIKYSEEDEAFY